MIPAASIFSIVFAVGWILGRVHWQMMDSCHPAKMVALGIYGDARSHLQHAAQNGSRLGWLVRRLQQENRQETMGRQ